MSGLGAALEALNKQGIAMIYNKTHYVLADGDYALAISEGMFGGANTTYYDLFRVENGKIAEHWDKCRKFRNDRVLSAMSLLY